MLNNVETRSDDALDQFTESQEPKPVEVTREYVDTRPVKLGPSLFRSTADAIGISVLIGIIALGITIKGMVNSPWRPK